VKNVISWYIKPSFEILFYPAVRNRIICFTFLVLTIFNEGAYLTFKSIFHNALNLF